MTQAVTEQSLITATATEMAQRPWNCIKGAIRRHWGRLQWGVETQG
jgi:hypothetical protein